MKRSDVPRRAGRHSEPCINVKHHFWWPDIRRKYETDGHEFSGDTAFWEWAEQLYADDDGGPGSPFEDADEMARRDGWEQAQTDAEEIWPGHTTVMVDEKKYFPEFPPGCRYRFTGNKVPRRKPLVQVYSEGRSGGWLVVSGLGDVDEWDLQDLNRWAKYPNTSARSSTTSTTSSSGTSTPTTNKTSLNPPGQPPMLAPTHDAAVWDQITRSLERTPA